MSAGYDWHLFPIYNADVDPQRYGSCYGFLRRNSSGGQYNMPEQTYNGSRSAIGDRMTTRADEYCAPVTSTRGCKKNVKFSRIILGSKLVAVLENKMVIYLIIQILMPLIHMDIVSE